jgi:hypothetical protein
MCCRIARAADIGVEEICNHTMGFSAGRFDGLDHLVQAHLIYVNGKDSGAFAGKDFTPAQPMPEAAAVMMACFLFNLTVFISANV